MIRTREIPTEISDYLRYEDGKLFWTQQLGRRIQIGDEAGSLIKTIGYRRIMFKGVKYYTHRIIWLIAKGEQPPHILDHINNNRLDNRIENLREATHTENMRNARLRKDSTSGVKGVYWHKHSKKWMARINNNNKTTNVGYFSDLKDAEQAVKEARQKLHQEFANNG